MVNDIYLIMEILGFSEEEAILLAEDSDIEGMGQ